MHHAQCTECIVKIKFVTVTRTKRWERGKETTFIAHKFRHALDWTNKATKIFKQQEDFQKHAYIWITEIKKKKKNLSIFMLRWYSRQSFNHKFEMEVNSTINPKKHVFLINFPCFCFFSFNFNCQWKKKTLCFTCDDCTGNGHVRNGRS